MKLASNLIGEVSNEQVQNETSDRDTPLLTSLINTIRRGSWLAGRFDGDDLVTGNLFKGGSSSKIDQPVDPTNTYTQESRCLTSTYFLASREVLIQNKHGRRLPA